METDTARGSAALGTSEITLLVDARGSTYRTTTQLRQAAPTLAREVITLLSALLFTERQMRATNDPARLAAVDQIANTCGAARERRLVPPSTATPRTVATYIVKLTAGQSFRVEVESKTEGILADVAGGEVVGALTTELLASLPDPYRTFYREMLEAAVNYWHERRPSLMESTWNWPTALRRLELLTREGAAVAGETRLCDSCGAFSPGDYACLRCGATAASPTLGQLIENVSAPAGASLDFADSASALAMPAPPAAPTLPSGSYQASKAPSILPAKELSDIAIQVDEPPPPVYAGPGRRAAAFVLDLVSGVILGLIGGFGLTAILVSNGAFGPADTPMDVVVLTAAIILALYLVLGWAKGETLGMALLKLRLLKATDQRPAGYDRALVRALGYAGLFLLSFVVFYLLNQVDNRLIFIQGTADTIVRIIVGLISLYVLWMGSGQLIIGGARRQSWGDRLSGTLVTIKKAPGT